MRQQHRFRSSSKKCKHGIHGMVPLCWECSRWLSCGCSPCRLIFAAGRTCRFPCPCTSKVLLSALTSPAFLAVEAHFRRLLHVWRITMQLAAVTVATRVLSSTSQLILGLKSSSRRRSAPSPRRLRHLSCASLMRFRPSTTRVTPCYMTGGGRVLHCEG